MGFCEKHMPLEERFLVHFANIEVITWSDTLRISMGNEKAPCPCFAPRGWTVSTQGGDFKLSVIWCPAMVSWGKHLLSAFESLFDYSTFSHRLSVCSPWKHCQLFKSSEILAGPNFWLWVASQVSKIIHFLFKFRLYSSNMSGLGEISWNRSVWEKRPVSLMFSNVLGWEKKTEV